MTDLQSLVLLAIARINLLVDSRAADARQEFCKGREFHRRSIGQIMRHKQEARK